MSGGIRLGASNVRGIGPLCKSKYCTPLKPLTFAVTKRSLKSDNTWEQMMTHCIITQLYNYIVYYTNYESWIMVIYLCIPIVYWFVMYNHYCANQFLLGNPPQRRRSPMHIACSETRRLSETRSSPGIISPRSGCETFVVWWLYRVIPHRIHVCYIW